MLTACFAGSKSLIVPTATGLRTTSKMKVIALQASLGALDTSKSFITAEVTMYAGLVAECHGCCSRTQAASGSKFRSGVLEVCKHRLRLAVQVSARSLTYKFELMFAASSMLVTTMCTLQRVSTCRDLCQRKKRELSKYQSQILLWSSSKAKLEVRLKLRIYQN